MARNEVKVTITGDADKFKRSLGEAETGLAKFSSKMNAIGAGMRDVGRNMTMGLTLPLVAGAGVAVKWAGELEDAQAMSLQVFGAMSKSMDAWAANSAKNFGLAKGEAVEWANQFGIRLRQIGGQNEQQAASTSQALTQLAGDFASAFGGSVPEAAQALGSALTGEFEPLKRYGVVINDLALKNKLFEMTGKKVTGTLTAQQKQQATLALVMEQSSLISGDYARNAEGATNSQRTMTASLKDAATTLGTVLLPFVTKAAQFISDLATKFSGLSPTMQKVIVIAGVVAAAIGPVVYVLGALGTAIGFLLSPVGLVVAAVAALVAGFVIAYKKSESFREIVDKVAQTIRTQLKMAMEFVSRVLLPAFRQAFEALKPVLDAWGQFLIALFNRIGQTIQRLAPVWQVLAAVVQAVMPVIISQVQAAMRIIQGIIQVFTAIISGNWSAAWNGIKNIFGGIWDGIKSIVMFGVTAIRSALSGLVGWVGGVFSNIGNAILAPFRIALGAFKSLWNSTIGGKGFKTPDWIPGIGGREFRIPTLHSGGIVPGPVGKDVLANLQAGEMVLSIAQVRALQSGPAATMPSQAAGTVINVNVTAGVGDPVAIGRQVKNYLLDYERVGGSGWRQSA